MIVGTPSPVVMPVMAPPTVVRAMPITEIDGTVPTVAPRAVPAIVPGTVPVGVPRLIPPCVPGVIGT
jgi:hypothetical protein